MLNIPDKNGTYSIEHTISIETATAPTKYGLLNTLISKIECLSDLHSKTCNNCDITSVINASVLHVAKSIPYNLPVINESKVHIPIKHPLTTIFDHNPLAKIPSLFSLGCCIIISLSAGSTPRAIAGKPSVAKLTNNICIGVSGLGK